MASSGVRGSPTLQAINAFIVLYWLDAGLTAADEIAAASGAGRILAPVRNPVGLAALVASVLMYGWMAFSTRLPKRILVPPILVNLWLGLGALPFALTAPDRVGLVAAAAQTIGGLYLLLLVRHATGGRALLVEDVLDSRGFRLSSTLGFFAANLVLGPVAVLVLLVLGFTGYIEARTEGFVSFDRSGVSVAERRYVRGDHVILLVGMMHIGESERYEELIESFPSRDTVILTEGLSDEDRRLTMFGYGRMAEAIGLDVQPWIEDVLEERAAEAVVDGDTGAGSETPDVENADLDVRVFAPETIELLNRIGRVWNLPDAREKLRELVALTTDPKAPQWIEQFDADVRDKRNRHLLAAIEGALGRYRTVVVPWGGLHLPWIERRILDRGFVLERSEDRRLLSYRTLVSPAVR